MVLSIYEKQRILFYKSIGLQPSQIVSALKVEDMCTRQTVARFIKRFQQTKTIARKEESGRRVWKKGLEEGSGRPSKIISQLRCTQTFTCPFLLFDRLFLSCYHLCSCFASFSLWYTLCIAYNMSICPYVP